MAGLDASAVAKLLIELGQRTALRGGNPYRGRAYRRAAESLLALTVPLEQIIAQQRLREIPGVGDAIAAIITKLHRTGTHPGLEALRRETPDGIVDLLSIPGLRPELIMQLHNKLGVSTLDDLERAARQDLVKQTRGLGSALQAKILQGLDVCRRAQGQRHLHRAAELLHRAAANLRVSHPGLRRITPAGEFRRGCELISDLALVAEAPGLEGRKTLKVSEQLTVHLADKAHYGIALLWATGSNGHVEELQALARRNGSVLDELALWRARSAKGASEKDIYAGLGLPFIEPELREARGEIGLALRRQLPRLVKDEDIRGVLHAHTEQSDGSHTLEQMVQATRERGYRYFGVADHSQSAHYAGGLSVDAIADQHAAIERLNASLRGGFRVFKGIESDILADGSLDYPSEVLARFDFVVASIHSRFRLDRETQTQRLLRAVENPYTTILGHMTGRQLLRRPGYEMEVEKVLAACARHGVAVEINANPWRLDLDWRWHSLALAMGCTLSINPDAHSISEIDYMHWGVESARKGGIPKARVLNCLELPAIADFLVTRRDRNRRRPRVLSKPSNVGARPSKRRARRARAGGGVALGRTIC